MERRGFEHSAALSCYVCRTFSSEYYSTRDSTGIHLHSAPPASALENK